jgi:hypothetical protein
LEEKQRKSEGSSDIEFLEQRSKRVGTGEERDDESEELKGGWDGIFSIKYK